MIPTIRELNETDIKSVEELDELSGNQVSQWLDCDDYAWGLFLHDKLIGYCTAGYADDCCNSIENHPLHTNDSILLSDVFILKDYRNKGYASQMIRTALTLRHVNDGYDETVYLSVLYDSLARLYEPVGFLFIDNDGHMMLPKKGCNV